jgi:hypothetical protein
LKPEWWGSPLVQEEKYQKKTCEKRRIGNNNNNNNSNNIWDVKVKVTPIITGTTRSLSRPLQKHLEVILGEHCTVRLQKATTVGTRKIFGKILT